VAEGAARPARGLLASDRRGAGFALETLQITRTGLRERLLNLYLTLDAFPEVRDTLARLKQAGIRTQYFPTAPRRC